jgi:hypothetical protein
MELREWKYMNSQKSTTTSSSGYKKRFEKLIKYHIDHASSELESITTKDIKPYGFHLSEHYNTGSQEFDRDIIVSVDKATGTFYLSIFVDGKEVYHNVYKSYEEVLEILTGTYMYLPDYNTPEYDDLLTESLNEWKLMNPPKAAQSAAKPQSQVPRYSKLIKQIRADGNMTYKINKFNDTILDITLDTAKAKDLNIRIVYNPADDDYELITNGRTSLSGCDYEKDILPLLIAGGIINNTDLCESASSIADDFKLYENLWENI